MDVQLNAAEIAELMKAVNIVGTGGYQSFMRSLQQRLNHNTGDLHLTPEDIERIPRYAFEYGTGGWETTLRNIFGRVLGPNLGR